MTLRVRTKDALSRFKQHLQKGRVDGVKNRKVDPKKYEVSLTGTPKLLQGKKPALAIFDGDIVLYHVTMSCLVEQVTKGEYYWHLNVQEARDSFMDRVQTLSRWMKAKQIVVAFSGAENFRKQVYKPYKAHRGWTKPLGYFKLKQWVLDNAKSLGVEALMIPTLEADDVMGIMASHPEHRKNFTPVIVSDDKDMRTIDGYHLKIKDNAGGIVYVSPDEAEFNFWCQVLSGDAGDGYTGIRGIGATRAGNIIGEARGRTAWGRVLKAYRDAGLPMEHALAQARCAYILRAEHYDLDKGKVRLWTPPRPKV